MVTNREGDIKVICFVLKFARGRLLQLMIDATECQMADDPKCCFARATSLPPNSIEIMKYLTEKNETIFFYGNNPLFHGI